MTERASVWENGKRRMAMLVTPGSEESGASVMSLRNVTAGVPGSTVVEQWTLVGSMPVEEFNRA